jgi:hypothetical protein
MPVTITNNWTLDPGANPGLGPFRRTASDGVKWAVVYHPRFGWLLSADNEPAGKFPDMPRAFTAAHDADVCRQ